MHGEKTVRVVISEPFWDALSRMLEAINVSAGELTERCTVGRFLSEVIECGLIDLYLERFGERIGGTVEVHTEISPEQIEHKRLLSLYARHRKVFGSNWSGKGFLINKRCSEPDCELCAGIPRNDGGLPQTSDSPPESISPAVFSGDREAGAALLVCAD